MMNYDPNLVGGRIAKQTVRLTFGMWDYRAEKEVVVYGNCLGLEVIDSAVIGAYNNLAADKYGTKEITMKNDASKELLCCDDEDEEEEWLKKMVVKAEIIEIEEDKKC